MQPQRKQSLPPEGVHSRRRRLEQLRSIPDCARTDADWDELNELEISFAPGNRTRPMERDARGPAPGVPRRDDGGAQTHAREKDRFGRPGKPYRV